MKTNNNKKKASQTHDNQPEKKNSRYGTNVALYNKTFFAFLNSCCQIIKGPPFLILLSFKGEQNKQTKDKKKKKKKSKQNKQTNN
ncbi:hypothetical protein RFI_19838 [Reticulomyxa filosa]|uniref:Uncharacterized protein n=1 Tax=Reticulomyxa filosa TaxID=46433 RepID=X6MV16_RETFI|nr:hypothetical protein RFI_19838 [Reticulomyxa filosa]|eukprot:ETO17481.1 hypothetical protein RFI_19838 [Reticulomyxa filosa]